METSFKNSCNVDITLGGNFLILDAEGKVLGRGALNKIYTFHRGRYDAGWDVLGFARQMQGLSAGAVTFRAIPTGSAELSTSSAGTPTKGCRAPGSAAWRRRSSAWRSSRCWWP